MTTCDQCGNDYDKAFVIVMNEIKYHFDCFECAVQKLAPVCEHCSCKVIGHGIGTDNGIFCCAHCAREAGVHGVADRVSNSHAAAGQR